MCLLLETIKVKDKKLHNIDYHNYRFNQARYDLFGIGKRILLEEIIELPESISDNIYKCRIVYDEKIKNIEFKEYTLRKINTLKLVECNDISYKYKYVDRTKINSLFEHRDLKDDIIIVENGFITDTSYANIIFWDGKKWITPSTPLLAGTTRTRLLMDSLIKEEEIKVEHLHRFEKLRVINAMSEMDNPVEVLVNNIS